MSVARLIKTGTSLMGGQGIMIVNQLLLPPLFLRHYGVAGYGEWIALSSAAQYLSTLNFGLHSFANNHVTIAYNRGDLDEANTIQATAFAIVLAMVGIFAAVASLVFLLPLSSWLHLKMPSIVAAGTVYFLGLHILVRLVFGFLQTAFLVVGAYHRGSNWNNVQFLGTVLVIAALVLFGTSFVWIAAAQMLCGVLFTILVGIDLYRTAPVAFPRLRYTSRKRVMDILRPSGYFGMLFSASFLVYQLPVLIMQRMLGPVEVVIFSMTRTIYSMSRQALTAVSTALGPEITEMYGRSNWQGLLRLYDLSERAVFSLVPVASVGTFLATPALMVIWLHKPELYHADVCIYMALISAAAGIKEHKYQFQISINHHKEMARFLFGTYVAMIACTVPFVNWFGIRGFLFLWLITETSQILYTVKLNQKLFSAFSAIGMTPLYRIGVVIAFSMTACWWIAQALKGKPWMIDLAAAVGVALALLGVEYPVFGLGELKRYIEERYMRRARREELTPAA